MTADENVDQTLAMIEGTNAMADAMDAMKRALEERGWSTPMSEQVGATFGTALFAMATTASGSPPKRPKGRDG